MSMDQDTPPIDFTDKRKGYEELASQLSGLLDGEHHRIANAANMVALIYGAPSDVIWVGFYFLYYTELVVGPFQGKPACVRIPMGRGVCGQAAARRETIMVRDVHAFSDHIVCDVASNSEIVVPLIRDGELLGVLDLDSPKLARFDAEDQAGLERLAQIYLSSL